MKVFLDYNSTTPVDPRVLKEMTPYFCEDYGNPSSLHMMGLKAKDAIENSRCSIAKLINAKSDEIYFTNSATEANNLILRNPDGTVITTNAEHSSVLECLSNAEKTKTYKLKVEPDGTIKLNKLRKMIVTYSPKIVTIIAANNEIGTIHDLYAIGNLCKKYDALFHTDATQAIGKIKIDVQEMNIFALTLSGHKIYGPKGVGALYINEAWKSTVLPLTHGGYQNTFISGTQNVPGIVGLGVACELTKTDSIENEKIGQLRDYFLKLFLKELPEITINGSMQNRLSNNLNISIAGINARSLIMGMDDVMISAGSACESGAHKPSHVIKAIKAKHPKGAIRISLGRFTTKDEIEYAAKRILKTVKVLRSSNE